MGLGPSCPPNDWYHLGEHYMYTWLTECPPPEADAPRTPSHLLPYHDDDPTPTGLSQSEGPLVSLEDDDQVMMDLGEGQSHAEGEGIDTDLPEDNRFASVHDH